MQYFSVTLADCVPLPAAGGPKNMMRKDCNSLEDVVDVPAALASACLFLYFEKKSNIVLTAAAGKIKSRQMVQSDKINAILNLNFNGGGDQANQIELRLSIGNDVILLEIFCCSI